ncbi:MAG: thrombospondin type 3 repeat-containing protein, partial [Saprospiraceae bacterium]
MKIGIYFLLALSMLLSISMMSAASVDVGPFGISNIATTSASTCSIADATITLTVDPSNQGVSPYDISIDNGATWFASNLTPNGSGAITVSGLSWGVYALSVRDASAGIIYPGYAQIDGCTREIGAFEDPNFSVSPVADATGYTWTTTIGVITGGQNTTSATFEFSAVAVGTTGTICSQPTSSTCTAPATCFDFRIVAIAPACTSGLDTDNDGISNICDLDDDNDGIPDVDECAAAISSGLTGPLTGFTTDISTTNANSSNVPHILNSITYN